MSDAAAVGVDVGGTKLVVATVAEDGTILDRHRTTSPVGDADRLVRVVAESAREMGPGLPIGIGVPGIVTHDGTLAHGPNIRLNDAPVAAPLRDLLAVPVVLKNDAVVALAGELRVGAAVGAHDVVLLTLGTGVGGGLAVGGELLEGANGYASELGHITVQAGGEPCPCGRRGCLEVYASGTAMGRMATMRLSAGGVGSVLDDPEEPLTGKDVTQAATDGDEFAQEILVEAGRWLGTGITSLVNALDPELILIGGGAATQAAQFMIPPARAVMEREVLGAGHRPLPRIEHAALGDDAGMIGAALLAAAAA